MIELPFATDVSYRVVGCAVPRGFPLKIGGSFFQFASCHAPLGLPPLASEFVRRRFLFFWFVYSCRHSAHPPENLGALTNNANNKVMHHHLCTNTNFPTKLVHQQRIDSQNL